SVADGPGDPVRSGRVDYPAVARWKSELLRIATRTLHARSSTALREAFEGFRSRHTSWLPDYTLFRALRDHFGGEPWTSWPPAARHRDPETIARLRRELASEVECHAFSQHVFERQWQALRAYAG